MTNYPPVTQRGERGGSPGGGLIDTGRYSYLSRENEQHRVMTSPDLDDKIYLKGYL